MYCPSCGFENPAGSKFCIGCGVSLQHRCPSCGHEHLPQARFCGECGARLTASGKASPAPSCSRTVHPPAGKGKRAAPSRRTKEEPPGKALPAGPEAEQGFPVWGASGTIRRGKALAEQGQKEEGITHMRQGLTAYRATGGESHVPKFLSLLAEAYGKVGQAEEGLTVLAKALAMVNKNGERVWEAELHRLKGELTLQQSGVRSPESGVPNPQRPLPNPQAEAEAEACFLNAIKIARHQQAKSLELRAVMSLSRLWQSRGKKEEARKLLAEVYGRFTEGFDTADLQEAKALLEGVSRTLD